MLNSCSIYDLQSIPSNIPPSNIAAKIQNKTKYTKSLSKILKKSDTAHSLRHVRKRRRITKLYYLYNIYGYIIHTVQNAHQFSQRST